MKVSVKPGVEIDRVPEGFRTYGLMANVTFAHMKDHPYKLWIVYGIAYQEHIAKDGHKVIRAPERLYYIPSRSRLLLNPPTGMAEDLLPVHLYTGWASSLIGDIDFHTIHGTMPLRDLVPERYWKVGR